MIFGVLPARLENSRVTLYQHPQTVDIHKLPVNIHYLAIEMISKTIDSIVRLNYHHRGSISFFNSNHNKSNQPGKQFQSLCKRQDLTH